MDADADAYADADALVSSPLTFARLVLSFN